MANSDRILDYEGEPQNPEMYLAGTGTRLANYILDRIGLYIFMFALIAIVDSDAFSSDEINDLAVFAIFFSIFGYWIIFEHFFGQTPAKFITQTKVVTTDGRKPKFWTIVGRTLCRFIPFEPFSFLGSKPVGWHDSITNTRVVTNNYELEEEYV